MGVKMKLSVAREIVKNKEIIYPEHDKVIERKIKILNKRADKVKNPETAKNFRDKALEWEALRKANFWNMREKVNV
jgi:hypothetical protein